jgi:hypothetical protein
VHFLRWLKNLKVRDLVCQSWVNPEEREPRVRAIFGRPLEPPDEAVSKGESNPVKLNQGESNQFYRRKISGMTSHPIRKWGEHPISGSHRTIYSWGMKHNKHTQDQSWKPAGAAIPIAAATVNQDEINFAPAPDEVARKAYFTYVNQGSSQGHEVQHWLAAEAELIAERNRTRTHGFHNKT